MAAAAAAATSQFVFPNLKNSDIVLCMQELGVPFSEDDIQKPTPQRMQMVYEAFADIIMGYTRDTFDANVRACAGEVDNFVYFPPCNLLSDLLGNLSRLSRSNGLSQAIVLNRLRARRADNRVLLMTQVGIPDFSIRDLIKPDAQKVKKILSAVINFAKFREEQLPVFEKHLERSVPLQNLQF
jgi:kinetochore protein Nuf2